MILTSRRERKILEIRNDAADRVSNLLTGLLYADSERCRTLATCFTIENPSLREMVEDRSLRMNVKV